MENQGGNIMPEDTNKSPTIIPGIELSSAILLAIATILGAFAAYQSSLWGGISATSYTKAMLTMSEANTEYLEAIQGYISEEIEYGFQELFDLHYSKEIAEDNNEFAQDEIYYRLNDDYKVYYKDDFTDEQIEAAVEAIEAERDAKIASAIAVSDEIYDQAIGLLEGGQKANTNGDNFGLVTVYFAIAMFFAGFVNIIRKDQIKVIFIVMGLAMFIFSLVQMLTLPFPV